MMIKQASAFAVAGCAILYLGASLYRLAPESAPAARGAEVPGAYTCLNCHGKDSDTDYPDDRPLDCNDWSMAESEHPAYTVACEDMLAFFAVVRVANSFSKRVKLNPQNRLMAGEKLAREYYCFQCHGELGQGGFPNPGALKGYVPGYFGNDFKQLTANGTPETIKTWIRESTNPELLERFFEGPIAAFFLANQRIQMPKFQSIPDAELQLLVNYVITINRLGPMTAATVQKYEAMTQSSGVKKISYPPPGFVSNESGYRALP